jgi:cytidyltransferase-like protein
MLHCRTKSKTAREVNVYLVLVTGGFDPIHSGHIAYLEAAAKLGGKLIVGVNSDAWLVRKKGAAFMPLSERMAIISALKFVDEVIDFDDTDGSAIGAIQKVRQQHSHNKIIFCNGGDRTKDNIPEMSVTDPNLEFVFGVGGEDKRNSSSWILKNWQYPKELRVWGEFSNLFQDSAVKVKELIVQPGRGISYQRHFKRSEVWYVSKGECFVKIAPSDSPQLTTTVKVSAGDPVITIPATQWHQVYNTSNQPCHIIEIQYGQETTEEDIERLEYYNEKDDY